MTDAGVIALRYARALLIHAEGRGEQDAAARAAQRLLRALRSHAALGRILADPILGAARKREVIAAATGGEIPPSFADFIRLVVRQGREDMLGAICLDYIRLLHERQRKIDVLLTTAAPVDRAHEQAIAARIEQLTGLRPVINLRVDPALVGGYIARWSGYRLDASVRGRLQRIEKALTR